MTGDLIDKIRGHSACIDVVDALVRPPMVEKGTLSATGNHRRCRVPLRGGVTRSGGASRVGLAGELVIEVGGALAPSGIQAALTTIGRSNGFKAGLAQQQKLVAYRTYGLPVPLGCQGGSGHCKHVPRSKGGLVKALKDVAFGAIATGPMFSGHLVLGRCGRGALGPVTLRGGHVEAVASTYLGATRYSRI